MGLGIKEPKGTQTAHVPGTSVLFEHSGQGSATTKHAQDNSGLILVPQPSDSPNDPLVRKSAIRGSCKAYDGPELASVEKRPDLFCYMLQCAFGGRAQPSLDHVWHTDC